MEEKVNGFLSTFYDTEQITEGLPNSTAVQLDISNEEKLHHYITQVFIEKSIAPRFYLFPLNLEE